MKPSAILIAKMQRLEDMPELDRAALVASACDLAIKLRTGHVQLSYLEAPGEASSLA